ncbi:MAG: hypothetical protein LBC67_06515 [Spirochaetales bacterium]|jgi:tetratricopeptide (TPR) repeat protein|nr:hypothetical protein [Spirochaetales bacterium]
MPLVEDIQQFIETLNFLGHEPEILSRSGERLDPVVIPKEGLPPEVEELLHNSTASLKGPDEPETPGEEDSSESSPLDFDSLFDSPEDSEMPDEDSGIIFDETEGGPEAAGETGAETGLAEDEASDGSGGTDGTDNLMEDLNFGEEAPAGGAADDDFDFEFDQPPEGTPIPHEAETPDEAAGEEAPDELGDMSSLMEGLNFDEEAPSGGAANDDLDLNFDLPQEDAEIPGETAVPDETSGEETPDELGDMSSLMEGLNFDEEAPPGGAAAEGLDFDFEQPQEGGEASGETPPTEPSGEEAGIDLPEGFTLEDADLPGGAEAALPDGESAAEDALAPSSDFDISDFGKDFGFGEGAAPAPAAAEAQINMPENTSGAVAAAMSGAFSLSMDDFNKLQETFAALPLNIRLVIEELIGDEKTEESGQLNLIRMLTKGASARKIAATAGKLIGRTLVIPRGYEKGSGFAYEAEKGSFLYFFRETVFPIIKLTTISVLTAGLLIFLGWKFVYKPIHAHTLLKRGYELVEDGHYREGNALFSEGYSEWQFKNWYFDYAEKFIERKQYQLAREKYQDLISQYDDYPHPRTGIRTERSKDKYFLKAILDYANFESILLENFEEAERILKKLLNADMYSYEGLLASGDNYIRWAEFDESRFSGKYEDAKQAYGIHREQYGDTSDILFRFLDLFMRTGVHKEVIRIKDYFEANPNLDVDPVRYAELGGYILDNSQSTDEAGDILFRAMEADENVPGVHYHLARYYNKREDFNDERRALDNSIYLYSAMQPISRRGLWRLVDSYGRSGELYSRQKSSVQAMAAYKNGIERYEDGLKKTLIKKDPALGRLYVRLGDLYYYGTSELEAALQQFQKAEDSLVADPGLYYKKGVVHYVKQDYAHALGEFTRTEDSYPSNRNLLFALGNANYMRSNFSIAQGYYTFLAECLEADRRKIQTLLPDQNAGDRSVLLSLIKAYNNLGVILYRLAERTGRAGSTSRAMALWSASSELAENYFRDRDSLERGRTRNFAYINMHRALHPLPGTELLLYNDVPRDLGEMSRELSGLPVDLGPLLPELRRP